MEGRCDHTSLTWPGTSAWLPPGKCICNLPPYTAGRPKIYPCLHLWTGSRSSAGPEAHLWYTTIPWDNMHEPCPTTNWCCQVQPLHPSPEQNHKDNGQAHLPPHPVKNPPQEPPTPPTPEIRMKQENGARNNRCARTRGATTRQVARFRR